MDEHSWKIKYKVTYTNENQTYKRQKVKLTNIYIMQITEKFTKK